MSKIACASHRKTFDGFVSVHRGSGNKTRTVSNLRALQAARAYAEDPCGWPVIAGGTQRARRTWGAAIPNYRLEPDVDALQVVFFGSTDDDLVRIRS